MRTYCTTVPFFVLAAFAKSQEPAKPEATPAARKYLNTALDRIQRGSMMEQTDWPVLRAKAHATIDQGNAKVPADTYGAIREALTSLGDKHSFFLDPAAAKNLTAGRTAQATGLLVVPPDAIVAQVVPGSPAASAGMLAGDRIVEVTGIAKFVEQPRREFGRLFRRGQRSDGTMAPLDLRVQTGTAEPRTVHVGLADFDDYLPPTGRRLDGGIGYVELPGLGGGPRAGDYDDTLHATLAALDDGTLRGWIVDLRRNTGGNMWPMLAGIGPLAGDGKLGAFANARSTTDWTYDRAKGAAKSGGHVTASVQTPFVAKQELPVAVLTSPLTASSGEAIVVAFQGRAACRRFGEPTRGVPTANATQPLADGALLVLTVSVDADRTGTRYDDTIAPDETVAIDWTKCGKPDDPVLAAACRWIAAQQLGK